MSRQRLGELLVASRVISETDLERALAAPRQPGQRLGDILIQMGLVTEGQLTQILGQQHSVPWVSLYHIDFSRQLLNLISRELADRYCLVPIYVRRVKRQDTLYVAMDDPSNEAALAEVQKVVGLPVKPMIAAPSDIRNAIRVYYGAGPGAPAAAPAPARVAPPAPQTTPGLSPLAVSSPPGPIQSIPPDDLSDAEMEEEPAPSTLVESTTTVESPAAMIAPPAPDDAEAPLSSTAEVPAANEAVLRAASGDSPEAAPEIEASEIREVPIPLKPKFGGPMVAITMLDGTTINLPARKKRKERAPDEDDAPMSEIGLTARDLVAALRAVAQGRDAKAVLGDDTKWEKLFATLLSILLKKGLIADWEFIDELRKM